MLAFFTTAECMNFCVIYHDSNPIAKQNSPATRILISKKKKKKKKRRERTLYQNFLKKRKSMSASLATPSPSDQSRKLWEHPNPQSTALFQFKQYISEKYAVTFGSEADLNSLWQWSVDHLSDFWSEVWYYTKIRASQPFHCVGTNSN